MTRRKARTFYEDVVLQYEGDDCITWPFSRTVNGYGTMHIDGRMVVVSRALCERVNGPAPSPNHQAAHSCGNGRKGCVTKRHLSWKTPSENQADRIEHGTDCRGQKHGMAKLTEAQAREVLALKGVEPQRSIARRLKVSQRAISLIHTGKNWAHLSSQVQSLAEKVKEAKGRVG